MKLHRRPMNSYGYAALLSGAPHHLDHDCTNEILACMKAEEIVKRFVDSENRPTYGQIVAAAADGSIKQHSGELAGIVWCEDRYRTAGGSEYPIAEVRRTNTDAVLWEGQMLADLWADEQGAGQ